METILETRNSPEYTTYLVQNPPQQTTAKQRLHTHMERKFQPFCSICPSAKAQIETSEHFLFSCPIKHIVWSTALSTYINPSLPSPTVAQFLDLVHMRSTFSVSSSSPHPSLSTSQVLSCILQAIWGSHYRFTFDAIPFDPSQVLNTIARALSSLQSQDNIHQLQQLRYIFKKSLYSTRELSLDRYR